MGLLPIVTKPPLVIDSVQLSVVAFGKIPLEKIRVDRFDILTNHDLVSIDDKSNKLVLTHRMSQKVEEIPSQSVVMTRPFIRIVIETEFPVVPELWFFHVSNGTGGR